MATIQTRPAVGRKEGSPQQSGARSGALLAAATGVSILAAYVFLLAAGRILGSEDYGSLAALLGLLAIVLIPAGALQMAVSREVSRRSASGDSAGAARLSRGTLRASAIATGPLLLVMLVLSPALSGLLHIHSVAIVVVAVLSLSTALVYPLMMGILQGQQRFPALASLYVFPWLIRLVVLGLAAAAGYRLGGAVFATFVGAVGSAALAYALINDSVRGAETLPRAELVTFLRYLWPVAVGLIGIALLTNVDVLIVKARFSGDTAGAYAAASAFARVGFFVPAAILAVLFPRTAARQARGEETQDILGRSLLATAGFCGLLALVYAAAGTGLVTMTFGRDFSEGGAVLGPFALAMGLFSLANVLVGYHLSRGETRYAWIVAGSVVVQVVALATIPSSLHGVVWTNVVMGVGLLAAHEVFVGSSVPALRTGWRHLVAGKTARIRGVAVETAAVLGGSFLVVCVLMWHVVVHLGSTITGGLGTDSTGSVAWLWTLQHESGYHLLGNIHHTLSGAPLGWNEGNGINVQWSLPYYPAYLATKLFGPVAAYNLATIAGYALSGAAMYLLVRYLGCSRAVSAWAGLAFIIFPWHVARAEHASLTHLEVLALLLLALVAAARRPTWIRFAFVGAATLACWLTSGYFGGMAVITTVAFAVGAAVVTPSRRRGVLLFVGSTGATVIASGLVAMAAYLSGTNASAGIEREASALQAYGLRPVELVVPSARHLVFGLGLDSFWARHGHGSNITEISNYLGLLTFALAIGWIVVVLRRRAALRGTGLIEATTGLVVAFVVGFLFALPSPYSGTSMPSKLLWNVLPAFRVPSRWDPLLMAALLPLAALGLQRVWAAARQRGAGAAVAVVAVAIVISFVELTDHTVPRFRTVPVPPEYTALKADTPNGVLAEYPLGYSDIYRLWQRVHGRPLVNGAPEGTTADQVHLGLLDPAEPGTASALSLLGVTAIMLHPGGPADVPVQPREPTAADGYRLVGRFPDQASVWNVVAPPAPALATLWGGFAPPRREGNGPMLAALVGETGTIELRAKKAGLVRLVFDAALESGNGSLHVGDGSRDAVVPLAGATTPVSVIVQVPRGLSQVLVKTDGDAIVDLSQPRAEEAGGTAALVAQPLSPDPGF